jgi:hypothetical protein
MKIKLDPKSRSFSIVSDDMMSFMDKTRSLKDGARSELAMMNVKTYTDKFKSETDPKVKEKLFSKINEFAEIANVKVSNLGLN